MSIGGLGTDAHKLARLNGLECFKEELASGTRDPDVRLNQQEIQSGLEVMTDSAGSGRSVDCPPSSDPLDLARSAPRDSNGTPIRGGASG
jgi:hypothetical protein